MQIALQMMIFMPTRLLVSKYIKTFLTPVFNLDNFTLKLVY